MRFGWTAVLAALVVVAALRAAVAADTPADVRVRASYCGGIFENVATTDVRIDPDGAANGTRRPRRETETSISLDFKLTSDEMDDLRRRVVESKFFDDWGPVGPPPSDCGAWDVTITLGAQEKRRPRVFSDPHFDPVAQFLRRFVEQADAAESTAKGRAVSVALMLRDPKSRSRLVRPDALVVDPGPELVRRAVDAKCPYEADEAARLLVELLPPDEWTRRANEVLAKIEGDHRDVVLAAWADAVAKPECGAHRKAFAPIAFAEAKSSWARWETLETPRQERLRGVVDLALSTRLPEAVAFAEEIVRSRAKEDRRTGSLGAGALGSDGVPPALRLLGDPSPEMRVAAAGFARSLIATAKRESGSVFSPEERTELLRLLASELVRTLDALAHKDGEPLDVRDACFRALDAWEADHVEPAFGGIRMYETWEDARKRCADDAARAEARRKAAEERTRARQSESNGESSNERGAADTSSRVAVRVEFGRRLAPQGPFVRLVPDGDDDRPQREFKADLVLWRVAPQGSWRVYALVRDLDGVGKMIERWMDLGTVKTGEPERTFVVPR